MIGIKIILYDFFSSWGSVHKNRVFYMRLWVTILFQCLCVFVCAIECFPSFCFTFIVSFICSSIFLFHSINNLDYSTFKMRILRGINKAILNRNGIALVLFGLKWNNFDLYITIAQSILLFWSINLTTCCSFLFWFCFVSF